MLLHLLPRGVVDSGIVGCLHLDYLSQIKLAQQTTLFWQQPHGQGNGAVIVSEGDNLDDDSQFVDAPSERLVFQDIRDHVWIDLPYTVAHLARQSQNRL